MGAIYSRTSMRGGGVCIFIQEEIDYTDIDLQRYSKKQELEIVAVKIKYLRACFSIYCLYRAPSGNIEYFYEQLDSLLDSHLHINSEIILCGDLNVDYYDFNQKKIQLENFLDSFNLVGTVHFPTRITPTTASTIDNIFIGKHLHYTISPYINGLSDHDGQILTLRDSVQVKEPKKYSLKRIVNEKTIANFQLNLSYKSWIEIFSETDVNIMFNKFLNTYLRWYNHSFPIQKRYISNTSPNKWITKGIIISWEERKKEKKPNL